MSNEPEDFVSGAQANEIRRILPTLNESQARDLARVVSRLVAALKPERIYAFGSYVKGTPTPDSDIDLLVVVPNSELPPHRLDQLAYNAIGDHILPIDVLVVTRQEFERQERGISSLPAIVLREGRILYAA